MRLPARAAAAVAAIVMASGLTSACSPRETPADIIEAKGNAAVDASMVEAHKTLGLFWAKFDAKAPGASGYVVKVAMKTKSGGTEYLWADAISHSPSEVVARLANDPVYLDNVKFGSVVRVPPAQIADWAYEKNGKLYGHYTTRALLSTATKAQRAEVEDRLSPTPLEPDAS